MFKLLREIKNLLKEIRDELRKGNESSRFVEKPFKRSFIGNDITKKKEIQNRKSFADKIKHTRKITYKGIPYKNKNYTFDDWKNHIGEVISFEVLDDLLLLNLEGQALYATTQDI